MKKPEAHHVLCIAGVTKFTGIKASIAPIAEQTKWCINSGTNMFAMPLWGHAIKWYCNLAAAGALLGEIPPPLFQNLPQHDYDHNSTGGCTDEVSTKMKAIARPIEEKAEESHKAAVAELQTRLNRMSNTSKSDLVSRGSARSGGTHKAWEKGSKEPESDGTCRFQWPTTSSRKKRNFPSSRIRQQSGKQDQKACESLRNLGLEI